MFKASYPNASLLKKVTQVLSKLSDELPFYVKRDVLEIRIISPDKTMSATLILPSSVFEEYVVENDEVFVVSASEFRKVIRRATRQDSLQITLNRETNEVVLTLRDRKTGVEREFGISLIPTLPEPIPELRLHLPVSFTMLSQDFKDIIGDLRLVSEEAVFMYEDGRVIVRSTEQQKEYVCELREGNPIIVLTTSIEKARSTYGVDMVAVAAIAASTSKNVTVSFDTNKPLRIEYELTGGGRLVYWITPRIQ